ncbi:(+)-neomenthol dehydrogenase-like isoform X2 [Diospyros lotus]|uniref:(+)-neomenthol dehydrogenase-like isoform X2 n=1 Tax=Diospyros lotus TaxID=55363 RepID=UPI002259792C|nr:(+)-neomenthol dehydrogenase-like isoform X2 [Diospyros lotus]
MEEASNFLATKRKKYAVVTGANRGMGFETCKQLASNGVVVVLTARDEKKEMTGQKNWHPAQVNNAAITGVITNTDAVRASTVNGEGANIKWSEVTAQTYDLAKVCLETNYYGAKRTTEALIPLLQLSDSARIVNVSSSSGKLKFVPNEWAKGVFLDDESLSEERIDEVLSKFLNDFKEGEIEAKGWPPFLSAYALSKAAMNASTRILAKRHPNFIVNSVCPGYVKTDMNCQDGILTVEEGSQNIVRLALLPNEGPSGLFFSQKQVSPS